MYNDRRKALSVNPRLRDTNLSILTKGHLVLALIGIFVSVSSGLSISLHASDKLPFDVDWACSLITESLAEDQKNENVTGKIEAVNPEQQTVKLEFKPAVTDWKVVQVSIVDRNGLPLTQARATPPILSLSEV